MEWWLDFGSSSRGSNPWQAKFQTLFSQKAFFFHQVCLFQSCVQLIRSIIKKTKKALFKDFTFYRTQKVNVIIFSAAEWSSNMAWIIIIRYSGITTLIFETINAFYFSWLNFAPPNVHSKHLWSVIWLSLSKTVYLSYSLSCIKYRDTANFIFLSIVFFSIYWHLNYNFFQT